MKKALKVLVPVLLIASLVSCAGNNENNSSNSTISDNVSDSTDTITKLTVTEAYNIAILNGSEGKDVYVVEGTIKSIDNPNYGQMTISDGTTDLSVYGVEGYSSLDDKPIAGDTICLSGILNTFNNSAQLGKKDHRATLVSFKHNNSSVDTSSYESKNIKEVRSLTNGAKVKLSGTVSKLVKSSSNAPVGFYLIDKTDSIYVYDNQIAARVSEGNKITICGERATWISEKELANAEKLGYKGTVQITNCILESNDNKTNEVDFSFASEKTMKDIINAQIDSNDFSTVYKVNAYITKKPEGDHVNYYFTDLDGISSTYVYTMANGKDYSWLDEFDQKVCTSYIALHNAKCLNNGYIARIIPLKVIDENFTFDKSKVNEFALDKVLTKQFNSSYEVDPVIEVATSFASTILNVEGVTVSYSSSDETIASFEVVDGKTYFHLNKIGETTITITSTFEGNSESRQVKVSLIEAIKYDCISIKDAIDKEDKTDVTIKGIVTSGTVNKPGSFYISDETGIIVVMLKDKDAVKELSLGDEVVVQGNKQDFLYNDNTNGQREIYNATILQNNHGNHEYSKKSFITTTYDEFKQIKESSTSKDTAQGYIVRAKLKTIPGQRSNTYNMYTDADSKGMQLYAGGNVKFIDDNPTNDEEVTLEVLICNWNGKIKFSIISYTFDNGKVVHNNYNLKA